MPATQSTTPSKKVPSPRVSVANTPSVVTPPARSAASPASYAKPSVPRKPSPSRPKSEKTEADVPPDMTLT